MRKIILATIVIATTSSSIFSPALAQEFLKEAPGWCQQALRLPFPSTPVAGSLDGKPFKFKQAILTPLPQYEKHQFKIEGESPADGAAQKIIFSLLTNDIEGKSFNVPHEMKKSGGIFRSEASFYSNDEQFNLYSNEYSARIVFLKKRADGLIPGYISFRAQSKLKKWKDSYLIGFFYARANNK